MNDKPHHLGHRQRLRERFRSGGAAALADYELLELLLFNADARKDMKPLAKALIKEFGSFADAISADEAALRDVKGAGDAVIHQLKLVQAAALRLARAQVINRPVISSWNALLDYCQAAMGYAKVEQFRVLFLDRKNVLIADEVQQQGTVDHTPVYPREVVKRAINLGASAVILVHNHPSGDTTPSKADIEMTKQVAAAGQALGIALHDHVVIGRGGHTSFKSLGLL